MLKLQIDCEIYQAQSKYLENEEKCSGFVCSDVKSYSRARNQTQWCPDKRIDPQKSIHHNRESISSTYIVRRYFDQGAQSIQLENESPFLRNGARNTGDMYLNTRDINKPRITQSLKENNLVKISLKKKNNN